MSISSSSSAKNLEIYPQITTKKRSIDLIKEYLYSQPDHIKKIDNVSKAIYETINTFIEITQNYRTQLEKLALKIIPNYTTEGQLAQAVQGILLFYSEGLNNLVLELKNENIQTKENELNNILKQFNKYKSTYSEKIKEAISSSEKFKKELISYQEYLVNKEYNEYMKNGNLKKIDDVIDIKKEDNIKEKKIKKEDNNKNNNDIKEISNNNNDSNNSYENEIDNYQDYDPIEDIELNSFDNERDVIESHKFFLSKIDEVNNYFGEIKNFLSKEKTNLRKNLFNTCDGFIEGLLKCVKIQKENYNIQNEVIKKLSNQLIYEEKDDSKIKPIPFRLQYLEIYNNYIQEKNDFNKQNNINNANNNNNKKPHLTTDDLDIKKKKISYMPRESYKIGLPSFRLDSLSRNTISFNQNNNKLIEELKLQKLKSIVIKLNRAEIIKIFNKIKNTNINISNSDIQLIEQETNYEKILEILVLIFVNTDKYTEKDKNILINFFEKDKIYIEYFIRILNNHRTNRNFIISENSLKHLGELFKIINNLILSKNDMVLFKYIFILSMTYYCISDNNMKIYVFSYIKDHPYYQKVKFWDDYLYELVDHDLKGNANKIDIAKKKLEELNKEERERLINCYFSSFLIVVKAMADFRMNKKFLRGFVEKNKEKYILSKEQIKNIEMIFDISVNDNKTNYNGDILNKEKQKNLNDKNNEDKKEGEKEENKKEEKEKREILENKEEKEIKKEKEKKEENNSIKNDKNIFKENENKIDEIANRNDCIESNIKNKEKEEKSIVEKGNDCENKKEKVDEDKSIKNNINNNNKIKEESIEINKEDSQTNNETI